MEDGETEGMQFIFVNFFSPLAKWWSPSGKSPSAFGLVVPRESKNFVSFGQLSFGRVKNFCPSGVLTHPLRTKIFHSPSGQLASGNKILTLPWDNKACGLRRKKNEKSFCHPSVPPSFGISCQIKSTFFFSYVHTSFFQHWIEFFQLTRLLLYKLYMHGGAPMKLSVAHPMSLYRKT